MTKKITWAEISTESRRSIGRIKSSMKNKKSLLRNRLEKLCRAQTIFLPRKRNQRKRYSLRFLSSLQLPPDQIGLDRSPERNHLKETALRIHDSLLLLRSKKEKKL